jgi:hypothetical protein
MSESNIRVAGWQAQIREGIMQDSIRRAMQYDESLMRLARFAEAGGVPREVAFEFAENLVTRTAATFESAINQTIEAINAGVLHG